MALLPLARVAPAAVASALLAMAIRELTPEMAADMVLVAVAAFQLTRTATYY